MTNRVVVALMAVVITACASRNPKPELPSNNPLAGTWELVSTRISSDSTVLLEGSAPEMRSLKILNATHYSVITRQGERFVRAGAGRYTLTGTEYTEIVDLASSPNFVPGQVYSFRITLDGDTWTTDGNSGSQQVHEVWRRVK